MFVCILRIYVVMISAFATSGFGDGSLISLQSFVFVLVALHLQLTDLSVVKFKKHFCAIDESFFDTISSLGWCLEESVESFFFCKGLTLLCANFSILFPVFFVSNQENKSVWLTLVLYFLEPVLQVHIRVHLCYVICKQHRMSTTIKDLCYRLERFLSSSVPDLQLEGDIMHFDKKRSELNANCHLMIVLEFIVTHPVHQTRLTNAWITNYN